MQKLCSKGGIMKKKLRLSRAVFEKAQKMMGDEMKDVIAATKDLAPQCCVMFCDVCGDSTGELLYFLPSTDSGDIGPC